MSGYYSAKAEAGKIYPCKSCGKTPEVGQERFYEKKGDSWIGCVDIECFKKQGGSTEPAKKSGGGRFSSSKLSLSKATEVYNLAEGILDSFYKKRQINTATSQTMLSIDQEAIFIESVFRTLSQGYKE